MSCHRGEHRATIFGASSAGPRSVAGSSPGIAWARIFVRSGPGFTAMTRTAETLRVSAA